MSLKHYVPISIGVFAMVILIARHFAVPISPFVVVLLLGETLIGIQLEDHKVARLLADLVKVPKSNPRPR